MTFPWAFPSHATRPVRPTCESCGAWHNSEVHRYVGAKTWIPVGAASFDSKLFGKPERIDLSQHPRCAHCRRQQR